VRIATLLIACALPVASLVAQSVSPQGVPANARKTSSVKGWECDAGYVERRSGCVSLGSASDDEIRRYLIAESIASYSGSCPCPYNVDRGGRRCGGRSAYSRPGGRSPTCYEQDVPDEEVRRIRARHKSSALPRP
jgi:hypothetical protein